MAVTELVAGIEQSAGHPLAALRVLLLEDSRADALLTEEYLRSVRSDVAVDHVTRLADLGAPQVEVADCALVDLELPDASGLSIVSTLRKTGPHLAHRRTDQPRRREHRESNPCAWERRTIW